MRNTVAQAHTELQLIVAGQKPYLRPNDWRPVPYAATTPATGVTLDDGVLKCAFDRNLAYLREWASKTGDGAEPANEKNWWETILAASSEGRMLGVAGHSLRWGERAELRRLLDVLVARIKTRQRADGYCLPYPETEMAAQCDAHPCRDERRNYDRVGLTRGLIAATLAGHCDALAVLRRFYDWLNASPYLAGLLAGPYDGVADKQNMFAVPPVTGTAHNCNNGHEGHLLMYFSAAGTPADLIAAERFFVQDFFLEASARRDPLSLSHYPFHIAHSYVLLAYKAWLDHYRATGAAKYLEAALGAWDIVHDHFLHIGGSLAICENICGAYAPDSFHLRVDKRFHTGETCGSVFWADINHRLLQFFPTEAKYADEIERSIYNCILACQDSSGHIRYHSRLQDKKEGANSMNTCCEVMGTPFIASLPQYVFSVATDGIFVNLFAAATITTPAGTVKMVTDFPFDGKVELQVAGPMALRLRIPSWVTSAVPVSVNGQVAATGIAGSYVTLPKAQGTVSFELPVTPHLEKYRGVDQDPQHGRYALLCGPILMALLGANDLDVPATDLPGQLRAIVGKPLHYTVAGCDGVLYTPYWLIDQETFTCFPTLREAPVTAAGLEPVLQTCQ